MNNDAIERWERADLWRLDEFATLCCGYDPDDKLSNNRPSTYYIEENQIREQIRRAVISGNLKAIKEPAESLANSAYAKELFFYPDHAVAWAQHRFSAFPSFSKNIIRFSPDNNHKPSSQNCLEDNQCWLTLRDKTINAIEGFPAWKPTVRKIQLTGNLLEWLKKTYKLNDREAFIVKGVLSEKFKLN